MRGRCYLSVLLLLLLSFTGWAQTGRVTGKVINEKNEPIPGVSIAVTGGGGATTNVAGNFTITLNPGAKFEISFSAIGYQTKTVSDVEVTAGTATTLDVVLQPAAKDLGAVTVVGQRTSARMESVNSILQFQRNTNTVASVISAETIRRSPDRNTGEVLKRIPGASIQDGRFLVIRGLADRYNLAMLNGVPLSSTEPDRKTFSFDLIPSAMIDNIVINKAFVPEMPGEWAGGLVQVNTKDIPAKNFFSIQAGFGFNTQTVSNDFYTYRGGRLDWLGIDDGTRALPEVFPTKSKFATLPQSERNALGSQLPNVWNANRIATPFNTSFQASGGFTGNVLGKKIGGIFGVTYNRTSRLLFLQNNQFAFTANGVEPDFLYNDDRHNQEVLWGALGNITLQLNNDNKISYKTLFNVNGNDYVIRRTGVENLGTLPFDSVRARELGLQQNIFWSNQVTGDHNIKSIKSKLRWYGSFNILDGFIPDQRRIFFRKDNALNTPYELLLSNTLSQRSGNRFFQTLSDYNYTAGGDLSRSFNIGNRSQTLKGGYMFQVRDRLFNAQPFSIALVGNNPTLLRQEAEQAFMAQNFGNTEPGKLIFDQIQNINFRYMANAILNAGFVQFDNAIGNKLRVVWGLRVEDFDQLVGSVRQSDPRHVNTRVTDFLPGVNATYKLNNKTNIRFSGSQTVVRPEFRELAPFNFYDFELNAAVTGFPPLERTKITNADFRYELYPRAGETFNIGGFYKYFQLPIEQIFFQAGGGASSFTYRNPPAAQAVGAELEFRKRMDFVPLLRNFTFQTNLAYIHSRIVVDDTLRGQGVRDNRPLQGQSPYVINAALMYDHQKAGLNATLLFNQIGRRIAFVGNAFGTQPVPDVWEAPRPVLDFQLAKKLVDGKAEVRLNVSDIFNRRLYFYQNVDANEGFAKGTDVVRFSRRFGTNVSVSFGYNF